MFDYSQFNVDLNQKEDLFYTFQVEQYAMYKQC